MKRRRLLKLAGGTVAVGGIGSLAGCSSSCPDADRPTPDEAVALAWGFFGIDLLQHPDPLARSASGRVE